MHLESFILLQNKLVYKIYNLQLPLIICNRTLFQLLAELHITVCETGLDCYQQKLNETIMLQVAGQITTCSPMGGLKAHTRKKKTYNLKKLERNF